MAGTILIGALTLTSCASTEQREESFAFSGQRLDVVNSHANMPVTVSSEADTKEVVVTVQTQTMGKSANTPAWSLSGSSLNLDTPCGDGVIGYCEGSYSIVVPEGTEVYINGVPAATA
ncbi:hypothetical protein [Rhodococcus sp. BE178]|uniref:hypothetical protein n=1 Tax=Rhodococcus sp. BE178 TaxID=2817737 RepID=UPI003D1C2B9B